MEQIQRLKSIIDRLRSPGGCPWDLEQTRESLRPFLLEEAHEVSEAILHGDPQKVCEELGDLLMNIFLQARVAEEQKDFTLEKIAEEISDKLIRRHPHVFGDANAENPGPVPISRMRFNFLSPCSFPIHSNKLSSFRKLNLFFPRYDIRFVWPFK